MKNSLFAVLYLFSFFSYGQVANTLNKTYDCAEIFAANDFQSALIADKVYKIRLKCSPQGSGNVREVESSRQGDKYHFEKEHNVVWIKFIAVKTGNLGVNIIPENPEDDYDFLVFKDEGAQTLKKIKSNQLKPIRSNIARTKNINEGRTGLTFSATETHVCSGPNSAYSKYLAVVRDEVYYLVLDNVYGAEHGALIELDYFKLKTLSGVVSDTNGVNMVAEISWENANTGEIISKTKSDSVSGSFSLEVPYNTNPHNKYVLSVFSDTHVFIEKPFSSIEISTCDPTPIRYVLPLLEKGNRIKLYNINFEGNQFVFLNSAFPTLRRLVRLMAKNPLLEIHVEGHTNGCSDGVETSQVLSENRATAVKNYLLERNISEARISTEGLNCRFMISPVDSSPQNQAKNRRVEIVVKNY